MRNLKVLPLLAIFAALFASACVVEVHDHGPYPEPSPYDARLDVPPEGCEYGPFSLALVNATDLFMEIYLDGYPVDFWAADSVYAELPPDATAYLCLEHTGVHAIEGYGYALRYGELVEVGGEGGRFYWSGSFGSSTTSSGRHEFWITPSLLYLQ
jgi:hypothetical protein